MTIKYTVVKLGQQSSVQTDCMVPAGHAPPPLAKDSHMFHSTFKCFKPLKLILLTKIMYHRSDLKKDYE